MTAYLIILGAGAILAGASFLLLRHEQRRGTERVKLLARLWTTQAGGRAAGYLPGSLSDPRD